MTILARAGEQPAVTFLRRLPGTVHFCTDHIPAWSPALEASCSYGQNCSRGSSSLRKLERAIKPARAASSGAIQSLKCVPSASFLLPQKLQWALKSSLEGWTGQGVLRCVDRLILFVEEDWEWEIAKIALKYLFLKICSSRNVHFQKVPNLRKPVPT